MIVAVPVLMPALDISVSPVFLIRQQLRGIYILCLRKKYPLFFYLSLTWADEARPHPDDVLLLPLVHLNGGEELESCTRGGYRGIRVTPCRESLGWQLNICLVRFLLRTKAILAQFSQLRRQQPLRPHRPLRGDAAG